MYLVNSVHNLTGVLYLDTVVYKKQLLTNAFSIFLHNISPILQLVSQSETFRCEKKKSVRQQTLSHSTAYGLQLSWQYQCVQNHVCEELLK